MSCVVRPAKPDDLAWVVDSWTKNAPELRALRLGDATRRVRGLLARAGSVLRVAHVVGEVDALLGWAALEDGRVPCLHYVYVRAAGRRQGIGRMLLADVLERAIDYTHAAPSGLKVPEAWTLNRSRRG